jgi:hypothetical protein
MRDRIDAILDTLDPGDDAPDILDWFALETERGRRPQGPGGRRSDRPAPARCSGPRPQAAGLRRPASRDLRPAPGLRVQAAGPGFRVG